MERFLGKILLGDCVELLKDLPDKSVDCVLTDVPYKQEFYGRGLAKSRPNYQKMKEYGSNTRLDYKDFFELCLQKLRQVNFFTFCDKETKFEFIKLAKEHGFGYAELKFCKTSPTPFCNNQWLPDTEYGIHIFKNLKVMGSYATKRTFFVVPNMKEPKVNHPSPKPVRIVEQILSNISKENDIILDPFSGSGTTAVACRELNRRFICMELNEQYWLDSCKRLESVQNQPTLL